MLLALHSVSHERFEIVAQELRGTWIVRMKQLLARLPKRTLLLWMASHSPTAETRDLVYQDAEARWRAAWGYYPRERWDRIPPLEREQGRAEYLRERPQPRESSRPDPRSGRTR